MTTYLTDHNIYVMGIQRTGQHAVIAWVLGHFDKACFRNSVSRQKEENLIPPFWYFDLEKRPDFKWETRNDKLISEGQKAIVFGSEFRVPPFRVPPIEDEKREMAKSQGFDEFAKNTKFVAVIRSPWNHLASVISWKPRWYMKKKERFIKSWIIMARSYLGIDSNLPEETIFVKYDQWFSDKKYRKQISKGLGLKFSDRGLNAVMPMGYSKIGSSFDQMKYNGNAQNMKVLDRWKSHINNEVEFTSVLRSNRELVELSKEIFGEWPFEI